MSVCPHMPYRKPPRSSLPLVPSRQLTNALDRSGAYQVGGASSSGSHVTYAIDRDGDYPPAAEVLPAKRETTRGVLQDILVSLRIPLDDLLGALGRRTRR